LKSALAWIQGEKLLGELFLDCRISKAQRRPAGSQCNYCSGVKNPTDHATREIQKGSAKELNWCTDMRERTLQKENEKV
jgi:hypothetical protein